MSQQIDDAKVQGGLSRAFLFALGLLMAVAVGLGTALGLKMKQSGGMPGLAVFGGGGSCGQRDVAAIVNGRTLTEADIDVELAVQAVIQAQFGQAINQDPTQLAMFRRELMGQLVDQWLLQASASAAGQSGDLGDLGRLLQQFQLDPAAFRQAIVAKGISEQQLDAWVLRQSANARYVESLGQPGLTPEKQAETLFASADILYCVDGKGQRPVQVGREAPDFELLGPDGKPGKLSDYRGRAVMLNFWATWCQPCKIEMPHLARSHEAFKDKLTVLAVSSEEQAATVQQYLVNSPQPFPVLLDQSGDVSRQYRVRGLPTTYFIGPDGIVLEQKRGAFATPMDLQPYVDRLLSSVDQARRSE